MQSGAAGRLIDSLRFWRRPQPTGSKEDMQEAWALIRAGQYVAAESACRTLVRANPAHLEALHCLAALHQRAGRHAEAVPLLDKVLALAPGNVPAHANLADSLARLGRLVEAEAVLDRGLALAPDSAAAARNLARACEGLARFSDTEVCSRKAIALEPDHVEGHLLLGVGLRQLGRSAEALAAYDQAARLVPNDPVILANRGNVLCDMGRIEEGVAAYRQSIRLRPDYAQTYYLLVSARRQKSWDGDLKAMERMYREPATTDDQRLFLAFGLGKACEDLGRYDEAFAYFAEGNRLRRALSPYSIADDEAFIGRLKAAFDASFFARHQGLGSPDRRPIFVLGLPRSGTTLIEQILASHPQVHGGGELPDMDAVTRPVLDDLPGALRHLRPADWQQLAARYLARLAARESTKAHITDKMPQNFLRIGMIATMLPNASIVHCVRDPLDTCLSAYKNHFASAGLLWSYDLADTGRYYRLYAGLMAHWRAVLPGRLIEVHYEALVADPETEIHRLLDACGLPFDAACLEFHRSRRAVLTRSFAQVRRPVYSDSVRGARRYEKHLGPLIAALGPDAAS